MTIGDIIIFNRKTGKYIGEITADYDDMYTVRTLAVVNHPKQGDLHYPNQADVAFFHERKALAFREQVNIQKRIARPYNEQVPDYSQSLIAAVQTLREKLQTNPEDPYNRKSLEAIDSLIKEYELMYSITFTS